MAPEAGVPRFVQRFQAAVARFQPAPEFGLAEGAVAVAAHLVGDVPQDHRRVTAEPAGQLLVDGTDLFPEQGRSVTIILAAAVQLPDTVGADAAHLRVFVGHPGRTRRTGRGQNGGDAVLVERVDDVRQPVQLVDALLRLQSRPGKYPQRDDIHVGFLHQFQVLLQNIRAVQPLFRVVVPAVEKSLRLHNMTPCSSGCAKVARFLRCLP